MALPDENTEELSNIRNQHADLVTSLEDVFADAEASLRELAVDADDLDLKYSVVARTLSRKVKSLQNLARQLAGMVG